MKLLIDIPEEFEQHFRADRFEDSLHRLSADAHLLAGNYEQETAAMLIEAFKTAVPVPPHGRLIDADALVGSFDPSDFWNPDAEDNCFAAVHVVNSAPTIIPASGGKEDE